MILTTPALFPPAGGVVLIERVLEGRFEPAEVEDVMEGLLQGDLPATLTAGLLVALRTRPVTWQMLVSGARAMRRHCVRVEPPNGRAIIDTCGTGGDGLDTVNISTAAALLVAACDGTVAKHGNRAISGRVGSMDVLEALRIPVDLDAEEAAEAMEQTGFAFLAAPNFHLMSGNVASLRRSLGVRTLFNLLGPLTNPAFPTRQLVGVYDPRLTEPMARALRELGSERALVVHCGGLDEMGLHADTIGHFLDDGEVTEFHLEGCGVPLAMLQGGDASRNAWAIRRTFEGARGFVADVVALNAGAALWVADICPSLEDGVAWAGQRMSQGVDLDDFRM